MARRPVRPAVRTPVGGVRFAPFRIVLQLDPIWDKMATTFAGVSNQVLYDECLALAQAIGTMVKDNIRTRLAARSFTGRLANVWGVSLPPVLRRAGGKLTVGPQRFVTIGLKQVEETVPLSIGRPVRFYASIVELGSAPHSRPWGRLSTQRIYAYFEATTGYPRHIVRRILGGIYLRGTRPYPYLQPSVKDAIDKAGRTIDEAGQSWRDRVIGDMVR